LHSLSIYDEIYPYMSFEDYEMSLRFFKQLLELMEKSKYEKNEELKLRVTQLLKKMFLKTFEKSTNKENNDDNGQNILQPKNYYFLNKSIILKAFVLIKKMEKILKKQELSNDYLDSFSKTNITFDKGERKSFMDYYNEFCSNLPENEEILRLISFIVFK